MCRLRTEAGLMRPSYYRFLALYVIGNDMRGSATTGNCVLLHHLC